ncbi:hypothetical protein D3C81_1376840 [compost metagenome]
MLPGTSAAGGTIITAMMVMAAWLSPSTASHWPNSGISASATPACSACTSMLRVTWAGMAALASGACAVTTGNARLNVWPESIATNQQAKVPQATSSIRVLAKYNTASVLSACRLEMDTMAKVSPVNNHA